VVATKTGRVPLRGLLVWGFLVSRYRGIGEWAISATTSVTTRIVLTGVVLAAHPAGTAGIHSEGLHHAVRDGADGDVHGSVHCYADHDRSTRSCLARHGQHTCHQNLGGDTYR
jgi:hypothetical protein